jgi:hypothetical protein
MFDRKNYNIFEIPLCIDNLQEPVIWIWQFQPFFLQNGEFWGGFTKNSLRESQPSFFVDKQQQKISPQKCWLRCTNDYIIEVWIRKLFYFLFVRTYFIHTLQKFHYQKWISKWILFQKIRLKLIKIGWNLEFHSQ